MKETTKHKLRYPEPKDKDTLAAYWQNLAEDTERELDVISLSQLVTNTPNRIIVCNASGVPTFTPVTGDIAINSSGLTAIQAGAVTDAKTAAANKDGEPATPSMRTLGTGAKQAAAGNDSRLSDERVPKDGSATSPKLKPTTGLVAATEDLALVEAYADVPGAELKITPAVASVLSITAIFDFDLQANTVDGETTPSAIGSVKLDAAAEATNVAMASFKHAAWTGAKQFNVRHTVTQVYLLTLTAALHTIKLRAKREAILAGSSNCRAANTRFLYTLYAS